MKKMKTGFGCVVMGVTIGIALHAVYLMNFIVRNAHKIALKTVCAIEQVIIDW